MIAGRSRELRRRGYIAPDLPELAFVHIEGDSVLKKLLAAWVVCLSLVVPSIASAATLDGETLTGPIAGSHCGDNGDGTTHVSLRGPVSGVAAGPVIGTFSERWGADFDTATGSVTDISNQITIFPADGSEAILVTIELGSGQGFGTCTDANAWTVDATGATYLIPATGETGVVSLSASAVGGPGTLTWVFGPRLPTSADQCQKDGWKSYGAFKNQGDCVSYVATKGKNKPAGS
jgi:hypothetical protein